MRYLKPLFSLLMIVAALMYVDGQRELLDAINPLQWIESSSSYVSIGTQTHIMHLTNENYCEAYRHGPNGINDTSPLNVTSATYKSLYEICLQEFNTTVVPAFEKLSDCVKVRHGVDRFKRFDPITLTIVFFVLYSVATSTAGVITVSMVRSRVDTLEKHNSEDRQKIMEARNDLLAAKLVREELLNTTSKALNMTIENRQTILYFPKLIARASWDAAKLSRKIEDSAHWLDSLHTECQLNRASIPALNFFASKKLAGLDTHLTRLLNFTKIDNNTFEIIFDHPIRTDGAKIYTALAMSHYRYNDQGQLTLMRYAGPHASIFNSTANCTKSITNLKSQSNMVRCDTKNYYDPKLDQWEPVPDQKRVAKDKPYFLYQIGWKIFGSCYGYNVTINSKEFTCPPYAWYVPARLDVKLLDHEHHYRRATVLYATKAESKMKPIEYSDTFNLYKDFLVNITKLQEMNEKSVKMTTYGADSGFVSDNLLPIYIGGAVAIILMVIFIICLACRQQSQPSGGAAATPGASSSNNDSSNNNSSNNSSSNNNNNSSSNNQNQIILKVDHLHMKTGNLSCNKLGSIEPESGCKKLEAPMMSSGLSYPPAAVRMPTAPLAITYEKMCPGEIESDLDDFPADSASSEGADASSDAGSFDYTIRA